MRLISITNFAKYCYSSFLIKCYMYPKSLLMFLYIQLILNCCTYYFIHQIILIYKQIIMESKIIEQSTLLHTRPKKV